MSQDAGFYDHSADRAIDLLRFGTMLGRGGTGGHTRMGWMVQRGAGEIIRDVSPDVTPETSRKVIRALNDALQQREDPAAQSVRSLAVNDRTGWQARFRSIISNLAPLRPTHTPADDEQIAHELALRGLQWKLAADQVKKVKRRPPLALSEVVPDILPAMPLDPYSGQPLLLLRDTNGVLIPYSVGRDGIDNGGNFATDPQLYYTDSGFDLMLPVP